MVVIGFGFGTWGGGVVMAGAEKIFQLRRWVHGVGVYCGSGWDYGS